ncbi:hypothetical protein [Nonomuraea sp. NPDC003804]|uniref:hypothetical protein n=1 Tax=Nonomuraea sp. NPDC003804 TaxID=3154547 RepID=UPI0033A5546B
MTETDPGFSDAHAGDVGARRATVGTPTDHESVNVPPTRAGAAENAEAAAEARRPHEEFVPEGPIPDDRAGEADKWDDEPAEVSGSQVLGEQVPGGQASGGQDSGGGQVSGGPGPGGRSGASAAATPRPSTDRLVAGGPGQGGGRDEIAGTRGELGGTVEAMVNKADLKGRASGVAGAARDRVVAVTDRMPDPVRDAADKVGAQARRRPGLAAVAAGVVALLVARRLMRRGKK